MKTDLEERFFEAFELGGIADSCMRLAIEGLNDEEKPEKWRRIDDERKRMVIEETNKFDFSIVNSKRLAPIFQEIQANLLLLSDRARESYIYGLLTPFKDWIRMERGRAGEGESEWSKGRLKHQAEQISKILNGDYVRGTIEGALQEWSNIVIHYSNRLDAILLQEGEDLLRYQQITGVKLIEYRDLSALDYYCGSVGVAKKYIAGLNLTPQPDTSTPVITDSVIDASTGAATTEGWRLPTELDTDRARKYFARAVNVGYMSSTPKGYKWTFGDKRGKARLAYFVERVYCPTCTDTIQANQCRLLERLFDVERLDRALQQNADTGKSQAVKKWRAEIDSKIFYD